MLQVSRESLHGQIQPSHAEKNDSSLEGTLKGLEGTLKGLERREYYVFAQHKAGWMMTHEAATNMNNAGFPVHDTHSIPWATSPTQMETDKMLVTDANGASVADTCFLHVARNPFEMLVSGYLYHMAAAEPWLLNSFEQAGSISKGYFPEVYGSRGTADVFNSSHSGYYSAWLPEAKAEETFPEYLRRVDLDAGLIAEFIWASNTSLAAMRFSTRYIEKSQCSTNICYNKFLENCTFAWERVLRTWEIQEPDYSTMLGAANKSCPGVNGLGWHSSQNEMTQKGLTHKPVNELVSRLRDLDHLVLNGTVAALEDHLGCLLSERYRVGPTSTFLGTAWSWFR